MRKMIRVTAAILSIVATGAFGGPRGDRGADAAGSGGGGISGVMNDALNGIQNGIRDVTGCCTSQPDSTKLGAVRSDATYEGVGAIGGGSDSGIGSAANGGGIGGGPNPGGQGANAGF